MDEIDQVCDDAMAIVRALAASDAPWGGEGIDAGCGLCDDLRQRPSDDPEDLAIHQPACPWRRAREWVQNVTPLSG